MNRFKQNAHEFLDERPQGEWEWILLARHHGLPSRLLDWTERPSGSLFASREDERYQQSDGALWCLSPGHLNEFAKLPTDVLPMFPDQNELSDEIFTTIERPWLPILFVESHGLRLQQLVSARPSESRLSWGFSQYITPTRHRWRRGPTDHMSGGTLYLRVSKRQYSRSFGVWQSPLFHCFLT